MTGDRDLVRVWLLSTALPGPALGALTAVLDADERRRADAFQRAADRRRFVVSHGAARFIAGAELGVPPESLRWRTGPNGKPGLVQPHSGTQVNLSHSGDLAAVAVSAARAVGVDVQRLTPGLDVTAMARRYFTAEEYRFLTSARDPGVRLDRFARLWARKEAVVKAAGDRLLRGMPTSVLRTGTVEYRDAGPAVAVAAAARRFRLDDLVVPTGYRAAVALAGGPRFDVVQRWWPLRAALPEGVSR